MATNQKVFDPTYDLNQKAGDELETAFANQGVSSPETRIWQGAVPQDYDIGFPRTIFNTTLQRAPEFSNKESRSVRVDVEPRIYDTDQKRLLELKVRVVERLTDRQHFPVPAGWNLIWQDLQNDIPQHDRSANNPDIYGRVVTVSYYMNRS
jgi:hypothetical protein